MWHSKILFGNSVKNLAEMINGSLRDTMNVPVFLDIDIGGVSRRLRCIALKYKISMWYPFFIVKLQKSGTGIRFSVNTSMASRITK